MMLNEQIAKKIENCSNTVLRQTQFASFDLSGRLDIKPKKFKAEKNFRKTPKLIHKQDMANHPVSIADLIKDADEMFNRRSHL